MGMGPDRPADALEGLRLSATACKKCDLARTRTHVVFGRGSGKSGVFFVGEAPGADEDRLGFPFVGRAGKLLDSLIAEIGLDREEVYVANILKCRPPGNRDPLPGEVEMCRDWLMAQIAILNPTALCILGRIALQTLIDPNLAMSRAHGRAIKWEGLDCLPAYHPAAALRSRQMMDWFREDFAALKNLLVKRGYFT